LKQILSNLISNAIKFTPSLGHIGINVDYHDENLYFQVTDDGIGVSKEKQSLIFDSFTQADNSTTRNFGGTGLGLHISKELIHLLGGDIELKSQKGKGSSFNFFVHFPPAEAIQEVYDTDDSLSFEGKILVAEDNKTNQLLIQMLLEDFGLESKIVNNGQEALQALSSYHPDLILMDINMPILDGREALKEIRNNSLYKEFKEVPIIALTANALKGDKEEFLNLGMDAYVSKPIENTKLQHELKRFLQEV